MKTCFLTSVMPEEKNVLQNVAGNAKLKCSQRKARWAVNRSQRIRSEYTDGGRFNKQLLEMIL